MIHSDLDEKSQLSLAAFSKTLALQKTQSSGKLCSSSLRHRHGFQRACRSRSHTPWTTARDPAIDVQKQSGCQETKGSPEEEKKPLKATRLPGNVQSGPGQVTRKTVSGLMAHIKDLPCFNTTFSPSIFQHPKAAIADNQGTVGAFEPPHLNPTLTDVQIQLLHSSFGFFYSFFWILFKTTQASTLIYYLQTRSLLESGENQDRENQYNFLKFTE